jgi:hypothetical protein
MQEIIIPAKATISTYYLNGKQYKKAYWRVADGKVKSKYIRKTAGPRTNDEKLEYLVNLYENAETPEEYDAVLSALYQLFSPGKSKSIGYLYKKALKHIEELRKKRNFRLLDLLYRRARASGLDIKQQDITDEIIAKYQKELL